MPKGVFPQTSSEATCPLHRTVLALDGSASAGAHDAANKGKWQQTLDVYPSLQCLPIR